MHTHTLKRHAKDISQVKLTEPQIQGIGERLHASFSSLLHSSLYPCLFLSLSFLYPPIRGDFYLRSYPSQDRRGRGIQQTRSWAVTSSSHKQSPRAFPALLYSVLEIIGVTLVQQMRVSQPANFGVCPSPLHCDRVYLVITGSLTMAIIPSL